VTFADTLAAMSGMSSETRDPGGNPQGPTFGLGDMVAANAAVLATLALLADQRGGHVDLSQMEAMAASIGPAVAEAAFPTAGEDHRTPEHPDRSIRAVPHGSTRPRGRTGGSRSPSCTMRSGALTDVTGGLGVAAGADLAGRRAAEDAIDAALAKWTAQRDAAEAAAVRGGAPPRGGGRAGAHPLGTVHRPLRVPARRCHEGSRTARSGARAGPVRGARWQRASFREDRTALAAISRGSARQRWR
jgi:hypothetical protein